jgi:succinate dehydrogenase/fumarate reductase iron-sulfur protein
MAVRSPQNGTDTRIFHLLNSTHSLARFTRNRGVPFVIRWPHRLSGLLLVVFVGFHFFTLSALTTPEAYADKMKLYQLPVLRNLVVDLEKTYDRIHRIRPFIIRPSKKPKEGQEYRISPRMMENYLEATRCINCFCCATACMSSHRGFIGPNAVMASVVRIMAPREDATEERPKQLYSEEGVYRCHTSKACSHVCPKEIDAAHFIGMAKEGEFS